MLTCVSSKTRSHDVVGASGEERPLRIVSLSSPGGGAGLRRDIPGSQKLTMHDRHAKSGTVKFIHLTIDLLPGRIPEAQSKRKW